MFRRAKLMLADLPRGAEEVTVEVHLTDDHGMPWCARLSTPATGQWRAFCNSLISRLDSDHRTQTGSRIQRGMSGW